MGICNSGFGVGISAKRKLAAISLMGEMARNLMELFCD